MKKRTAHPSILFFLLILFLLSGTISTAFAEAYRNEIVIANREMISSCSYLNQSGGLPYCLTNDTLLYVDENGEYQPNICNSFDFNADGTLLTIHLPEDLRFYDGTNVTANDWKRSFEFGLENSSMAGSWAGITSVEADGYDILIHMDNGYSASIPFQLSSVMMPIVCAEDIDSLPVDDLYWNARIYGSYYVEELVQGDHVTLKANPYDADNESHSTATVRTTIVGIFKGDSDRKVASRAELTSNTVYTDLDTTSTLYQYKVGKEIYQDATFVLDRGVDVEKTMEAAKKLPVDWNNYQITRNDQYTSSMLNAARSVRSMMRGALIGVTISAVIVLSLMLLLWMNDRRQEMGVLVSLGIGKPSLIAQYLTEMILIGLPSLVLGWLCARGAAQWLGTSALRSVNASAAKELSSMGQVGGDLESNMSVRTLDSLTVSIDTTAVLYVSLGLLAVMLVCVAISCIPMLRKSPRSLSELR